MSTADAKTCVLTGGNGFVGSRIRKALSNAGWRVISWLRRPDLQRDEGAFELGQEVGPTAFRHVQALVHCAYDFQPHKWEEIRATNVTGSQTLFAAAREQGVATLVEISSLSAFEGCRSMYGKAKLETEQLARSAGAYVIRPGLVYGSEPGGVFGRLVAQVKTSRILPILSGGRQAQYMVHEEDLGKLIAACLRGEVKEKAKPISIAHDRGWELSEVLLTIARSLQKPVSLVPVPWRLVWLTLRSLEIIGKPARFRSDSLISMVYQNPAPSFELLKALGFSCRAFELTPGMLEVASNRETTVAGRH